MKEKAVLRVVGGQITLNPHLYPSDISSERLFSFIVFCAKWNFDDIFYIGLDIIEQCLNQTTAARYCLPNEDNISCTGKSIIDLASSLEEAHRCEHALMVIKLIVHKIHLSQLHYDEHGRQKTSPLV